MADTKQPEFQIHFSSLVDEASAETRPEVVITTLREFTSFGYGMNVDWTFDSAARTLAIDIGGMTVPGIGRPEPGPARAVLHPDIPDTGEIAVLVKRKTEAAACTVTFDKGRPLRLVGVQEGGLAVFTMEGSTP